MSIRSLPHTYQRRGRLLRVILCALTLALYLRSDLAAQNLKPFPHVPTTVSPQAQGFLKVVTPPSDGDPQTEQDWKQLRRLVDFAMQPFVTRAKQKYPVNTNKSQLAGVDVLEVSPAAGELASTEHVILYIHGGAYTLESAETTLGVSAPIVHLMQLKVVAVNYRLAPEHPFPAALDDCFAVYQELLKSYQSKHIVVFGESAGGGLALATILRAQTAGLDLPAAIGAISPWTDLTKTGDTYYTLEGIAPAMHYERNLKASAKAYAGKHDMKTPLISPVYADYKKGYPPVLIQVGTRDLFLSNCARLQRKLLEADVDVTLSLWEGMWHVFQGDPDLPEGVQAHQELTKFLQRHIQIEQQ